MAKKWYKLDNAALIYAPSANSKWSCVFRHACVLNEEVDPDMLQQAVDDVTPRFPTFMVKLRAGIFWYYFETIHDRVKVECETGYPCSYLNIRGGKHLFRVMYYGHRIAMECFHGVADGGAGLMFLKTIVHRYLQLKGVNITTYEGCLNYLDKPTLEETEDAYRAVADMKVCGSRLSPTAYMVRNPYAKPNRYYLTHGQMSTNSLKVVADKYSASIGHIITAAILYALYLHKERAKSLRDSSKPKQRKNLRRPVVLCASIDLRRRFPGHNSLRNFSHYINISLGKEQHTFDTVLQATKDGFALISDKYLMDCVNSNIKDSERFVVKFMPTFVKRLGFSIAYEVFGEPLNTVSMSNYGKTAVPKEFYDHVYRFESSIGVAKIASRNLDTSVITFGDRTVLTFCSMGVETYVERECFRILTELGVDVTVDSNRREFNE